MYPPSLIPVFTLLILTTASSAMSPRFAHMPNVFPRQNAAAPSTTQVAQQLASGIGLNIMAQQGEVAATTSIQNLEKATEPDMTLFLAAKFDLLTFVMAGINLREQNQILAQCNPQVAAGLLVIQQAQLGELALASNLTGNPTTDAPILTQLQADFQGGIMKNMALQSLALGLSPTGAVAAAPASTAK